MDFFRGGGVDCEVDSMTIGQTITIRKKVMGCRGEVIMKKIQGQVVQVCDRFVAVHNGKYVECVWLDQDAKNNPVVG